ncbi:MAG TPA: TetR/AcrR family transcriptional regulator [Acidimicrobiia bacterium]|jgi:AcrR family transcriptional regulator
MPSRSERPREEPKQWELRAALRVFTRAEGNGGRSVAHDIVDAAWKLVEQGDTDFTVKQVAEGANVALQTFYRHFGSKDELLLAMLEESISQGTQDFIDESVGYPPVERLHRVVTAPMLLKYDDNAQRINRWRARERQRLLEVFPDAVEAVFEPYRRALVDAIVAVCDDGDASCDDPELTGTLVMHLVQTMTHAVHGGGLDARPEDVAEQVWRLCWDGLAARERPSPSPAPRRRRA